jgi:ribosome-associated heat shock protein Hsp15
MADDDNEGGQGTAAARAAPRLRVDRWLWCARLYRSRALAARAVAGGKVHVNGERVKPAKTLKAGDRLAIRIGPYTWNVSVMGLSDRRGPAPEAQKLYAEGEESRLAREVVVAQVRAARPDNPLHKGRPTKKARRDIDRLQPPED